MRLCVIPDLHNRIQPAWDIINKEESEVRYQANMVIKRVNLINANEKYPDEISGGMKKRVAIARAIVMNPKYLFCDEPNSGLDPKTAILIDNLIQEITEEYNITTVINTHDMNSVMEIGKKIVFLQNGEKAWEGTTTSVSVSERKLTPLSCERAQAVGAHFAWLRVVHVGSDVG